VGALHWLACLPQQIPHMRTTLARGVDGRCVLVLLDRRTGPRSDLAARFLTSLRASRKCASRRLTLMGVATREFEQHLFNSVPRATRRPPTLFHWVWLCSSVCDHPVADSNTVGGLQYEGWRDLHNKGRGHTSILLTMGSSVRGRGVLT